jgi:hypothetical protein
MEPIMTYRAFPQLVQILGIYLIVNGLAQAATFGLQIIHLIAITGKWNWLSGWWLAGSAVFLIAGACCILMPKCIAIRLLRRSYGWWCPHCGYDIRPVGGSACPECGNVIGAASERSQATE